MRYRLLPALLLFVTATQAFAQQSRSAERWLEDCRKGHFSGDRDREQYCDVRQQTIPTRSRLRVDGRENGGIEVIGSDGTTSSSSRRFRRRPNRKSDAKDIAGKIPDQCGQ